MMISPNMLRRLDILATYEKCSRSKLARTLIEESMSRRLPAAIAPDDAADAAPAVASEPAA